MFYQLYVPDPKFAHNLKEVTDDLVSELDIDTEGANEETLMRRVAEALADKANFDKAREVIRDTIESQSVKQRQRKRQDFVASQIDAARGNLRDANTVPDVLADLETRFGLRRVSRDFGCLSSIARTARLTSRPWGLRRSDPAVRDARARLGSGQIQACSLSSVTPAHSTRRMVASPLSRL